MAENLYRQQKDGRTHRGVAQVAVSRDLGLYGTTRSESIFVKNVLLHVGPKLSKGIASDSSYECEAYAHAGVGCCVSAFRSPSVRQKIASRNRDESRVSRSDMSIRAWGGKC